ncbi:CASP-like protein 1E1 [Typha latifolia]|uniref:CASP-like protein 1E1 n=1 Tax=Typha latifolia TaxID=4733 RepID=UPI003C2F1412
MERGYQTNPNYPVAPPPTTAGNHVNFGAQASVGQGNNFPPPPSSNLLGNVLRGVPILLTFLAAVLMGSAKDSKALVKSTDSSALVYFTVINSLVCVYSVGSLIVTIAGGSPLETLISIADLIVLTFLFTCNGAASAISVILNSERYEGISTCALLHRYCSQIKAAIVFSMFASIAYLLLIIMILLRNRGL